MWKFSIDPLVVRLMFLVILPQTSVVTRTITAVRIVWRRCPVPFVPVTLVMPLLLIFTHVTVGHLLLSSVNAIW